MASGYSGTPLARKLGIKQGHIVSLINEPDDFRSLLDDLPDGVEFRPGISVEADIVVAFHVDRADFEATVTEAADAIFPAGAIWVAWPKRASKVPTDMTEDVVREVVLPMKLVDNKVCAINEVWSGLRVVWRKEHRASKPG